MMVHGDSFNDAFTANLIGLGVGGVIGGVGGVIGRGLRSGGGDSMGDTVVRTIRRPHAEAQVNLRQRRAWSSDGTFLHSSSRVATRSNSGNPDVQPFEIVREVRRGENLQDLLDEMKAGQFTHGEHALLRVRNDVTSGPLAQHAGQRVLVRGGMEGIDFPDNYRALFSRLIAHTHPAMPGGFHGASVDDRRFIEGLGQFSSILIERGMIERFFR